jgi:hypothetical protein
MQGYMEGMEGKRDAKKRGVKKKVGKRAYE